MRFDPPSFAAEVGPLPAQRNGFVTLASFNRPNKISPPVIAAWSEILRRLPTARLRLKYNGWDDEPLCRHFLDQFAEHGVGRERIDLRGWSPHAESLAEYNEVDLALDPYPFSGSATTCDALWMGVPVVTLPVATFMSRHTLSHLSNIGLGELVARDWEHYVELVVGLASDLGRLQSLRAGLRERVATSPLCDGDRYAGHLLALLREAWEKWVASGCYIGGELPPGKLER